MISSQPPCWAPLPEDSHVLRLCNSLNLLTQCLLSASGILQNTIALVSSANTFSAILSCKSLSSLENSAKKMSIARSCHEG